MSPERQAQTLHQLIKSLSPSSVYTQSPTSQTVETLNAKGTAQDWSSVSELTKVDITMSKT